MAECSSNFLDEPPGVEMRAGIGVRGCFRIESVRLGRVRPVGRLAYVRHEANDRLIPSASMSTRILFHAMYRPLSELHSRPPSPVGRLIIRLYPRTSGRPDAGGDWPLGLASRVLEVDLGVGDAVDTLARVAELLARFPGVKDLRIEDDRSQVQWCPADLDLSPVRLLQLVGRSLLLHGLSRHPEVTTLMLSHHGHPLVDEIADLPRLTRLVVEDSRVHALPEVLAGHPALAEVDLTGDWFTEVPGVLRELPALHTLDLSRNDSLATLPEWLGRLPGLRTLVLPMRHMAWGQALAEQRADMEIFASDGSCMGPLALGPHSR